MPREVPVSVLLDALAEKRVIGTPPVSVTGLTADSRRVARGDVFVAVPGFKQDARRFVPDAVGRGASLVVTEREPVADVAVPQVVVPSARRALAALAGAYWDHPSRALTLVGITGTNGKTTTSYLVDALLRVRGGATGILGTIQYVVGDEIRPAGQTTPEALEIASPLIGEHNGMNRLAAVGVGWALGLAPDTIARALGGVQTVPGRFEQVRAGQPFLVVVDYAHTPDALERVLTTARKITSGRLGVVFGCGGDRDRTKRPIMGEIAARLADRAWITSDNPRSENPDAIIAEIAVGVARVWPERDRYGRLADRRAAITAALAWAGPGDAVGIRGQGHRTYPHR